MQALRSLEIEMEGRSMVFFLLALKEIKGAGCGSYNDSKGEAKM